MKNKLQLVREHLEKQKLDALVVSGNANIIYLTGYDNFSLHEREALLLITPKVQYIFTDARYSHAIKTLVKDFTLEEIGATNAFAKIKTICEKETLQTVGIEKHNLTVSEFERLQKTIPGVTFSDAQYSIEKIRQQKTDGEIQAIHAACKLGDKAFDFILTTIKPGLTEKQIAFELELFVKRNGAEMSFNTIVAFGKNAAIPHHQTSDQKLKTKDLILLDYGVRLQNYCSDMTRTVFLSKASHEQKKIYQTVYDAQQKALEFLHSSFIIHHSQTVKASDVDHAARQHIIGQGFPSIPHSLGHGIGIEVHELPYVSPKSETKLTNGMVFSIEPGIYLSENTGVRIEDLVAIKDNKPLLLTNAPKDLIEL